MSINREALVSRHNPVLSAPDPFSPLSVGNGEFAFTADITGLQTFLPAAEGSTPLCTMSQWGWHSYPLAPGERRERADLRLQEFQAGGRRVGYMTDPNGQEELFSALRVNPHRLNLARVSFVRTGPAGVPSDGCRDLEIRDLSSASQTLDLWRGRLESSFRANGVPVAVLTAAHPALDLLSFRAESSAFADGSLAVLLSFPYGSHQIDASDWTSPAKHETEIVAGRPSGAESGTSVFSLRRVLDADKYFVSVRLGAGCSFRRVGPHSFLLSAAGSVLEASILFSRAQPEDPLPSWESVSAAAERHWAEFWRSGGAVELAGSLDPRALELERRIILSQYLTAIQCSGSLPPQETGLTCNSWYGKFHLEMHYWHAAHFALWGRSAYLARSLLWYRSALESAKERAAAQGYRGARWPKMTDPGAADSPSPIGPLLCWQQPHIIMYAELLRRSGAAAELLRSLSELVFETAEFMADYASYDEPTGRFVLGPPLIPAQESHKPEDTLNPTFELEYWRWGLETALEWLKLFGTGSPAAAGADKWRRVLSLLAVPAAADRRGGAAVYPAHELCSGTFSEFAVDHPSMLLAMGMLPGASVDGAVMSSTYDAVLESWDFVSAWGWDFPAMAMTAARLGRRKDAVDALLMDSPKNTYRPNGHNAQLSRASGPEGSPFLWTTKLPLYLPGNGALLLAVGMMAGGWDGDGGQRFPGFPENGSWKVESEGLGKLP